MGGSVVYSRLHTDGRQRIHAYHTTTSKWSQIPDCPVYRGFALAVINGTGSDYSWRIMERMHGKDTDKVLNLTGAGEDGEKTWTEDFPPMPTKCYTMSVHCAHQSTPVHCQHSSHLRKVFLLELYHSFSTWTRVADLPASGSTAVSLHRSRWKSFRKQAYF